MFGGLFTMWGPFATFYFMVQVAFFGLAPPPPTKISAGAHYCKEGSRACSPEKFLCDRNLVSSGPVLLQFCLKNDKNNDASKAFDRVNLLTLFKKLFERNMCPLFLRFLIHSYCNQKMRIKWNAAVCTC